MLVEDFHLLLYIFSFQEAEVRNEESSSSGVSKSGKRHVKPVDPDPNGEKLLQVPSPFLFPSFTCLSP